jgi:hypothetical protein
MATTADEQPIMKLKKLITHINGKIEYIKHKLIPNVKKSFESKYKSILYKDKKAELNAEWEKEYHNIQILLIAYKTQKNVLDDIVTKILGGRGLNSPMKGAIQTVAKSIYDKLDIVLNDWIVNYRNDDTIPGNFVIRHVARSRSRRRSPPRTRLQSPVKSSFRNTKRHGRSRSRSRSRSPTKNGSKNKNRNGNRNKNRKTTIRFNNRTKKYEIESLKTNNLFNNRSAVTHKTAEIKNKSLRGTYHAFTIKAAANSAAAAAEAQDIVSTISSDSNIFQDVKTHADNASAAARSAAHNADIFDESLEHQPANQVDAIARQLAESATHASYIAIAALKQIKELVKSSNPSAAASANRRNST